VAVAVAVVGVMVAATVIEPGHLLHYYWSRPDTAGSVFRVTVIREAQDWNGREGLTSRIAAVRWSCGIGGLA